MPFLDIAQSIYSLAKIAYEQAQVAKSNQTQCKRLAERINVVVQAVKHLEKVKNSEQYMPGLLALRESLEKCLKFIQKFSDEKKWFKQVLKFLKAQKYQEKFNDLTDELFKAIEPLNLGLNAQQVIDREQDKKDQHEDFQVILQQQETIIELNRREQQFRQKLQLEQQERDKIIQKQLASMKAMFVVKAPKPVLEAHLMTAYYELAFDEKLASGSFGEVYLGQWNKQTVAIKALEGDLSDEDQAQFIREVQIMSRLRSPHIVQLYSACLEPTHHCLVMEYMEKGSLYRVLGERTLSSDQQKQIALEIAKGLDYLHHKGVIHRDLKSANILLNSQNQAKIADFGLSKIHTRSIQTIRQGSQAVEWQAPECFQRKPIFSAASDIYSFGMVLWEIFSGKRPYADLPDTRDKAIIEKVLTGERESLDGFPAVLKQLIEDCWQADPVKRPKLEKIIQRLEAYQPPNAENYYQQGQEFEKAKELFEAYLAYQTAAEMGHMKANTCAGLLSLLGQGTSQNKSEAYQRFLHSAHHGHVRGMMCLAKMLANGEGVTENKAQALIWYEKAGELGDPKGITKAQELRKVVKPADLENARKEIKEIPATVDKALVAKPILWLAPVMTPLSPTQEEQIKTVVKKKQVLN